MTDLRDDPTFDGLRSLLAGDLLTPESPGYDDARTVFNAMIDVRPGLVVQCTGRADVALAVAFAREHGLEVSVRGGGHSVAGLALTDGGLVVDLRRMNAVSVDPIARTATVGGGATMADLDRACAPHGLATTGGRVSTTGVGGFVLGGGTGWLDRLFGLACDNLLEAEVVTADGEIVRAAEDLHPELFWALHGGGGNFGVVTSMTLRLHALEESTLGLLLWPPERGPEIVRLVRDLFLDAPDTLGGGAIYLTGPEGEDFVPADLAGRLAVAAVLVHAGSERSLRDLAAPLFDAAPAGAMVAELPYDELQSALDDPPGHRNYWSAEHLVSLPDEAIDAFCAQAAGMVVPSASQHVLFAMGGAVARGPRGYPIPWRHAGWVVHPFGLWTDPADDDRGRQWARDVCAAVRPWSTGAVYLNFIGDEGQDRVVSGFGEDGYQRLAAVKARYDPTNLFRRNHNVRPA
ncbi:FAD-binding oxidoreductase [Jiangella alkaliphila]|uniref:FAD/FMN-containing dehydrogenase n=1 Tax=Jiangella alkaliphila TaxID=419479 RepID=A0A1H2JPV8_9ACTN|nr:FAD-binding oxidoreductase [Jiangella alkaliphila]SDU58412.1 FAD/FMN-containing dehydrogenase [Jiangella alkaliphila]